MGKVKRYNFIFVLWALISTAILVYLFVNQSVVSNDTIQNLQKKIDSIEAENLKLDSAIFAQKDKAQKYQSEIDSLKGLEAKIITKYVNKYKEIDSASVGVIVANFDSIFAANGYK